MKIDPQKYYVLMALQHIPEGMTKDDVTEMRIRNGGMEFAASHAFLLGSFMRTPEGGLTCMLASLDGTTGKAWTDEEVFRFWTFLAKHLAARPDNLKPAAHDLVLRVNNELEGKS